MRRGQKPKPETIERMRAGQKRRYENPVEHEKSRVRALRFWEDPEYREKHAGDNNPMKRPEMRAQRRGDNNPAKRPEVRKKMSIGREGKCLGDKNPSRRPEVAAKKRAAMNRPETKAKNRIGHLGDKNPAWLGGITTEPYGWEWNDELREEVRRRDGYRCQLCGVPQVECKRKLTAHHINYLKKDNDPLNLIALCSRCHGKTVTRRKKWTAFFGDLAFGRLRAEHGKRCRETA